MLSIGSLLNPVPERRIHFRTPFTAPREKRLKMAKDAPIFRPGKTQGECRYPPHENPDPELEKIHREFSLHPMGLIGKYPRHIPYASDKKTFQERTGRDSFHVFQYTFRIPGDDKEWHVMWDYNIGIVRITHLFKCNGYSKTTPGKMLNQNPGLRDICHSITGGALSAQGYWMPYDAAKAMAATFCWNIRYALTPLFGKDFPAMCIHPTDRKNYGRMVIPQEIVQRATETARYYRSLELGAIAGVLKRNDPSLTLPPLKISRHRYAEPSPGTRDSSIEPYCISPKSPELFTSFTPVNAPRSSDVPIRSRVESPKSILQAISEAMRSDNPPTGFSEESDIESDGSSNMYSTPNCPSVDGPIDAVSDVDTRSSDDDITDSDDDWQLDDANDEDYRGPSLKRSASGHPITRDGSTGDGIQGKKNPSRKSRPARPEQVPHFAREVKAAEALLRLHMDELETSDVQTEGDEDGVATPFESRSLDGDSFRSRKRRRASL